MGSSFQLQFISLHSVWVCLPMKQLLLLFDIFPPFIYLMYDLTEIENFYFEDKVSRWGIFNLYFFSTNRLIILLNVKRNSDVCKPIVLAPTDLVAYFSTQCCYSQYFSIFALFPWQKGQITYWLGNLLLYLMQLLSIFQYICRIPP